MAHVTIEQGFGQLVTFSSEKCNARALMSHFSLS